ncbi:MAG: T9SS type A sorting domain-containing protein, partial [Cyclobacteriaceae bacterium]
INYDADATSNLASGLYTWTLSDSIRSGQNLQHRFPGVSTYSVQLHVKYPAYNGDPNLVCQDSLRLDQIVGPIPKMDFEFFDVCESDQTSFEAKPDIPISTVSWDFGDGETTALGFLASSIPPSGTTSGTYEAPIHSYSGADSYNVTVTGKTAAIFGGCEDTEVHEVAILKNWASSPAEPSYDMAALDGGKGFWVKEDAKGNSTWEFNTSTKPQLSIDEMAWVTGSTQPYKPNDASYMNSPCFDLSGFSRPVLSLKHWANTDFSDGAVLQYSVNGGESWTRLGDVASGLDWYNRPTINSNPGEQSGLSSGWSTADQETWATGKHTLDVIPPVERTQVRFRVAFASHTNLLGNAGFAFNNVVIEERNRTLLVENFTNLQQTQNNVNFRAFRAVEDNNGEFVFNPEELVKLQYHHTSAQNDAGLDKLNQDNPVDPNARAAFYGVTNAVRAFIDGGYGQQSDAGFGSGATAPLLLQTYFSLRSLVTSPVNISIDFKADPTVDRGAEHPANADSSKTFNVKATVQATSDLGPAGQYNVFIAMAEQEVDNQVYVLRKFLPDASGTPLTSLSATDVPQVIYATYDMRHMTRSLNGDLEPFAVIVFVQHLETKDVLQTIMRQDGTGNSAIVTGVETSHENYVRLYPNPADDLLNVILPAPVKNQTPVKVFDTFGREVFNGTFRTGEHVKTIETKTMSAGVYLIQLSTPEGLVQKKAVVVHE